MQKIPPPSQHMGGGTGPADPVTAGPMFAVMVPERLANEHLRSPKFQEFSARSTGNQLLDRQVSQIVGLKHMTQTMEFRIKQVGPLYTVF